MNTTERPIPLFVNYPMCLPNYLGTADGSIIAHNQPFTAQVQLAAGITLKHLRVLRLMSTTHQFGAAEGDVTLTRVSTPTGPGWSLTRSVNLTPPGYDYLVAVDSRDVPSTARIIKVI